VTGAQGSSALRWWRKPKAREALCVVTEAGPCPFTVKREVQFDLNAGVPATLRVCAWHGRILERLHAKARETAGGAA
jgi:hypothetical protein